MEIGSINVTRSLLNLVRYSVSLPSDPINKSPCHSGNRSDSTRIKLETPTEGTNAYTGSVPIDIGGERSLAASDQRHRAVFNGIWDVAYGVQLSGIYFYGSGERTALTSGAGVSTTLIGAAGSDRLRADGTPDPGFQVVPGPFSPSCVALQPDGRILIGGNGALARLNSDGTRDACFNPAANGMVG